MSGKTTITVDREVALKLSQASREFGISALRLASDSLEVAIEALCPLSIPAGRGGLSGPVSLRLPGPGHRPGGGIRPPPQLRA